MIVNFEFLGSEPIENVITCMNYRIDKTVFFGYNEVVQSQKGPVKDFLCKACGVGQVVFHQLSSSDLQSVLKSMRREIEYELAQGNDIYFDITGGESLILVAFGILSNEYETPMHLYDIEKNKLIELDEGALKSISVDVPRQNVELNLDSLIKLRGGTINYKRQKSIKTISDRDFAEDVDRIWEVALKHIDCWNVFSHFLNKYMSSEDSLNIAKSAGIITKVVKEPGTNLGAPAKLNEILDDLENAGAIRNLVHADGVYSFSYKNREVANCLCDGGSILELYICRREKKKDQCSDCRVGIHLDWDGVIQDRPGIDVLNEIDVLTLETNVPTFISCKSGKIDGSQALYALYELETVAQRFGGKYAKKVLVICNSLGEAYRNRADEMGIEIWEMAK